MGRDGKQDSQHNVEENEAITNKKPVEDNVESSSTNQDKILKKPDKILQCPRCNSLDTKFCYFNNYNVNQPRHFCKNCQRYWTAGGTMRNVPVGAGRRKHKHLASQYRHIIVTSDGVPTSRLEATDSSGHKNISCLESSATFSTSKDNGTVLKFGPDTPLCESMESMLNLRDQKRCVDASSINCAELREDSSLCGSSVTNVSTTQGNESSEHNTSNLLQCYPVPPWVLPWNQGWNNVPHGIAGPNAMQWCPTPMVATIPGICTPTIPVQLVPAPYWGGTTMWNPGTGTVSIGSNPSCLSPSSSTSNSCCSGNNGSPTLGKHTRDTVFIDEEKLDKCVLVPKAPRIDDPNGASKSPIWATLAIMHDEQQCVSNGDILKKIEFKGEGKDSLLDVTQMLEANPAAISRAHAFH